MKLLFRWLLRLWAYTGLVPGYLYFSIEKWGHLLGGKSYIRTIIKGNKIVCDLTDHVQQQIYFFGAYEPIDAYLFTRIIKPNMTLIDAGANVGFYSLLSSPELTCGKIYAFEPVPRNYQKFLDNIKLSPHTDAIIPVNKGLWDKIDTLVFSLPEDLKDNQGTFSAGDYKNSKEKFSCEVTTLDAFVRENKIEKVNMIKMDIEGAELNALKGMQETLKRDRPIILMEVNKQACQSFNYSPDILWDILAVYGYKALELASTPQNCKMIQNFSDLVQSNVFLFCDDLPENVTQNWTYKGIKKYFARS